MTNISLIKLHINEAHPKRVLWKMHCEKMRHYLLAQSEYRNYFRVPKTSERSERVDFQNLYFGSIQRKVTQTNRNLNFFS